MKKSKDFAIVSGRSNPELVVKVSQLLKVTPIFIDTEPWPNKCPKCIGPKGHSFAGEKVIIITNLQYNNFAGSPVEELDDLVFCCSNAKEVHVILTYFCGKDDIPHGYSHLPNLDRICGRIRQMQIKSISWFDPHHSSQPGKFWPIHYRRFYFLRDIIDDARILGIDQVAAPDDGAFKRARKVESFLKTGNKPIIATKEHAHQTDGSQIEIHEMSGQLRGTRIGIFDDMALGFGTLYEAAKCLNIDFGAKNVFAATAHFDPAPQAYDRLMECFEKGWLKAFTTTNSTRIDKRFLDLQGYGAKNLAEKKLSGFRVIDIAPRLKHLVELLVNEKTTADLFLDI